MVRDKAEWLCQELLFQYSLCRVVLMVDDVNDSLNRFFPLSVLALSSRFDGLCSVKYLALLIALSVLALSSRFDGHVKHVAVAQKLVSFSTRSVESF